MGEILWPLLRHHFYWTLFILQVTRACINAWMSLNFSQIGQLNTELAAHEHIKIYVSTFSLLLLIGIFNSLLSLSLLLALAIINIQINYSDSIPIGSLLDSASESDSKSKELKMSNTILFKLADNQEMYYILDEFEFPSDWTTGNRVRYH